LNFQNSGQAVFLQQLQGLFWRLERKGFPGIGKWELAGAGSETGNKDGFWICTIFAAGFAGEPLF
jgi:hypothetical protein